METEMLEKVISTVGPMEGMIATIIAAIIQNLKRFPFVTDLREKGVPVFRLGSLILGVGGAHLLGLANPAVAGLIIGLIAMGEYDLVKGIVNKDSKK